MPPSIRAVATRGDFETFVRLPYRLYAAYPAFVPPLIEERRAHADRARNPFFDQAEGIYFLAWRGGAPVGRVAAFVNRAHNDFWHERTGFFGLFDLIDDPDAGQALLRAAEQWLKERGMARCRGPANFSTNHECGMLVDAFDLPPVVLMAWNPPYLPRIVEAAGYKPAMDLLAYRMDRTATVPEKVARVAEKVRERSAVVVRPFNLRDFPGEMERVRAVYRDAWAENWGFVPMSDREFDHMARELRPIIVPDLAFFGEKEGQPVGFSLTLPDVNEVLPLARGSLKPFGWLRLWRAWKTIRGVRVFVLGVVKEHRRSGLAALFYLETWRRGLELGYTHGEMSWILANNVEMNRALLSLGAKPYKTYRFYERDI
ncbi:MAG: GNAT family N-acetyltransferase [Planctomycetes bacterium]|nr:GNAT family N-acetyltransferase [Planctomycetota bacterium]